MLPVLHKFVEVNISRRISQNIFFQGMCLKLWSTSSQILIVSLIYNKTESYLDFPESDLKIALIFFSPKIHSGTMVVSWKIK